MKKIFLKYVVVILVLALSVQIGSFVTNAASVDSVNVNKTDIEALDESTSIDEIEKVLSSYVGYYEADRDVFISGVQKLIKDKQVANEYLNMFSSCRLGIDENGDAVMAIIFDVDPCEVKMSVKMEFVSVTDSDITFGVKCGDNLVESVFKKEEKDGRQYLVCEEMGVKSYFEKIG